MVFICKSQCLGEHELKDAVLVSVQRMCSAASLSLTSRQCTDCAQLLLLLPLLLLLIPLLLLLLLLLLQNENRARAAKWLGHKEHAAEDEVCVTIYDCYCIVFSYEVLI